MGGDLSRLRRPVPFRLRTRSNGVAAYSAGNHASAVSAAAKTVGCPAVIVAPNNAPRIKVENCRWWGAEVVFYDPATEDRAELTQEIAQQRGLTIISPFDDHAIMAGAGTTGLEVVCQESSVGRQPHESDRRCRSRTGGAGSLCR